MAAALPPTPDAPSALEPHPPPALMAPMRQRSGRPLTTPRGAPFDARLVSSKWKGTTDFSYPPNDCRGFLYWLTETIEACLARCPPSDPPFVPESS